MATQITSKATIGELSPRGRTFGGRLTANRQLRGVAIIAALVLAVVASLAIGRAFQADQARGALVAGFTETREQHQLPGEGLAPVAARSATGGGQQAQLRQIDARDNGSVVVPVAPRGPQSGLAWFDARDYAPVAGVASAAGSGTGGGFVEYLPGEERSTSYNTSGGDSAPCQPLQPCDH